jgi:hypothetical protein
MTRGTRPLFDMRVIGGVAADLRAVIDLLQRSNPPARGVALLDRLLTDGRSAFYGHQVEPLRDELERIRHALDH